MAEQRFQDKIARIRQELLSRGYEVLGKDVTLYTEERGMAVEIEALESERLIKRRFPAILIIDGRSVEMQAVAYWVPDLFRSFLGYVRVSDLL